jgi:hypothetical protein
MNAVASVIGDFDQAMQSLSARWYLFGAQAVVIRGRPRVTADVDTTIEWPVDDVAAVEDALKQRGFTTRVSDPATFVQQKRVLPIVQKPI